MLHTNVRALPASFGTPRVYPLDDDTGRGLRVSFTSGPISSAQLTTDDAGSLGSLLGGAKVSTIANNRVWIRNFVDELNFELEFDRSNIKTGNMRDINGLFTYHPSKSGDDMAYDIRVPTTGTDDVNLLFARFAAKTGARIVHQTDPGDAGKAYAPGSLTVWSLGFPQNHIGYIDADSLGGHLLPFYRASGLTANTAIPVAGGTVYGGSGYATLLAFSGGAAAQRNNGTTLINSTLDLFNTKFGIAPSSEVGIGSTDDRVEHYSWYKRPFGTGWIPLLGIRAHGVHPTVSRIVVIGGKITEIRTAQTGIQLGSFCNRLAKNVDAKYTNGVLTAASNFRALGGKVIQFTRTSVNRGPLDIYTMTQLARATASGASEEDIDAYIVGSRRLSEWRKLGLAKPATKLTAGMGKIGRFDYPIVRPARLAGVLTLDIDMAAVSSATVLYATPAAGFGANAGTQYLNADQLETALAAEYPMFTWVSDAAMMSARLSTAALVVVEDAPTIWFESLGFSEVEGLGNLSMMAVTLPMTTP